MEYKNFGAYKNFKVKIGQRSNKFLGLKKIFRVNFLGFKLFES